MKRKLSKQQLEVMKVLWDSQTPLVASAIIKQNNNLNINTVQACLRALIKIDAIEIAGIVYSGTVLTRSYRPLISRDEYFDETYKDIVGDLSDTSLIASLINTKTDLKELEQLENIIKQRKSELGEV